MKQILPTTNLAARPPTTHPWPAFPLGLANRAVQSRPRGLRSTFPRSCFLFDSDRHTTTFSPTAASPQLGQKWSRNDLILHSRASRFLSENFQIGAKLAGYGEMSRHRTDFERKTFVSGIIGDRCRIAAKWNELVFRDEFASG